VVTVQFRVLGPLEVRASDDRLVQLGAEKPRILLAALLLSANQSVDADRLVEALWSGHPPRSAANALRTYVSGLRGRLRLGAPGSTSRIIARGGGYQIRLSRDDLDLLAFEDLAASGHKALADGDAATAAERLRRALDLWRGRPLEDVPLAAAFDAELARLEDLRLTALEACVEARLALGQHTDLITDLRAAVAAQPLRERLQALWMLALYRCGQQAEALAAYRTVRDQMVHELGIEPGPPMQRLHRQILTADPTLDPPAPDAGPDVVPRQLPPDIGGFTGRDRELARLGRLLRQGYDRGAPLITAIDGVPGVGKSALAVHAAHRLAYRFPDGQLYADLQGATPAGPDGEPGPRAPMTVLLAFLRALGTPDRDIATQDEAAARFRAATADRRLLVVLDNARDAAQIQPLLPAGPGCAVLVTSRRVLATLDGATPVHLDVLAPAEAVTLLGRLAGGRRTGAEREAAAEVARLCGYLPLALRIAAARLTARPSWPVRALVERLTDTHRRLDELQAGDLGVRTSFQVSLVALRDSADPRDRAAARAFPLLGVLDGADVGIPVAARLIDTPEADAEAALERLVDAQLLDSPVPGRYRLHDLLRLFARERAAEERPPAERAAALVRALTWYRAAACRTLAVLRPGHQHPVLAHRDPGVRLPFDAAAGALDWLETERINLVAAVEQAAATTDGVPAELPITITQALFGFFQVRGYWQDWIRVNETVLGLAGRVGDLAGCGYAHRDIGVAHELAGDYDRARVHVEHALTIFERIGDRHGQAANLTTLAIIHHRQGRYPMAVSCYRRSLAIRRDLDDTRGLGVNLSNLGVTHQRLGENVEADACFTEALAIFERLADRPSAASVLTNLGVLYESEHRYPDAVRYHERSLEIFRAIGDHTGEATALNNLGLVFRRLGRYDEAIACQREGLAITERLGERFYRAECLRELGSTWHAVGDHAQARTHWEQAREIFAELGVPEADEVAALLAEA
jgi:DNA-binding SARP family transcriptional activator/Tfp pilus assembly protein PilF